MKKLLTIGLMLAGQLSFAMERITITNYNFDSEQYFESIKNTERKPLPAPVKDNGDRVDLDTFKSRIYGLTPATCNVPEKDESLKFKKEKDGSLKFKKENASLIYFVDKQCFYSIHNKTSTALCFYSIHKKTSTGLLGSTGCDNQGQFLDSNLPQSFKDLAGSEWFGIQNGNQRNNTNRYLDEAKKASTSSGFTVVTNKEAATILLTLKQRYNLTKRKLEQYPGHHGDSSYDSAV